jgi:hypothetical protein
MPPAGTNLTNLWTELRPENVPPAVHSTGMAYDVESDAIILFGGISADDKLGETWSHESVPGPPWGPLPRTPRSSSEWLRPL